MGADKILIACCTASTVYAFLSEDEKHISIPIIDIAASVAANLKAHPKVAVISTEHTATSHAFLHSIISKNNTAEVIEIPTQMLVSLVELGARDGELLPREATYLDTLCEYIKELSADALILGCTHFSSLGEEFKKRLQDISVINPALLGARALAEEIMSKVIVSAPFTDRKNSGKTIYM